MIKKKTWARIGCVPAVFALVFGMTGCRSAEKPVNNMVQEASDTTVHAVEIDSGELTDNAVVMAVGKEAVTVREAMFYLEQVRDKYEPAMGREIWGAEIESGQSFMDFVKDDIISEITEVKIISQEAVKQGVVLSDVELEEAAGLASDYMGTHSEDPVKLVITEELVNEIYKDHLLAGKMFDVTTAEVNTDIPDDEARQITIQYLMVRTDGTDKNGRQIMMDQKEKQDAKKKAKDLLKKVKKEDSFYNFAEVNGDNETVELTFGRDNMPKEFGTQAFALKTGEYSGMIEGKNGYYLLYCTNAFDEEKTLQKKEKVINDQQNEVFQKAYREWSKSYEVLVSDKLWQQIQL